MPNLAWNVASTVQAAVEASAWSSDFRTLIEGRGTQRKVPGASGASGAKCQPLVKSLIRKPGILASLTAI